VRSILCCSIVFELVLARPSPNKLICLLAVCSFVVKWRQNMLFLTNELPKKAEITILPARDITQPGLQAGAS